MTDIVWYGCATYSVIHPLRAIVHLGALKCTALIDTGSDYDALDSGLSVTQEENKNLAFRSRSRHCISVSGFADHLKMQSDFVSEWEVTLIGNTSLGSGNPQSVSLLVKFTELSGLGDPLILGMPTIDQHGGM